MNEGRIYERGVNLMGGTGDAIVSPRGMLVTCDRERRMITAYCVSQATDLVLRSSHRLIFMESVRVMDGYGKWMIYGKRCCMWY